MRSGYWVMAVFATSWASAGLLAAGYSPVTCLLPALVSGAILLRAYSLPSTGGDLGSHTRTVLARWSLVEGLGGVDEFEPVSGGGYMNHAHEAFGELVVARGDGAVDL